MKKQTIMYCLGFSLVFTGCNTKFQGPEAAVFGDGRVTHASANQLLSNNIEQIDDFELIWLLDPKFSQKIKTKKDQYGDEIELNIIYESEFEKLEDAEKVRLVNLALINANSKDEKRRNLIQDRFIVASNNRCNLYFTYLKGLSTGVNNTFGILTTILAGAGSIVTHTDTARLLSGGAAISSGTRAELNQNIFNNLTTNAIIPAIINEREKKLSEIKNHRNDKLEKYSVAMAIADAIDYHGKCSLDIGIKATGMAVNKYTDLGLKEIEKNDLKEVEKELVKDNLKDKFNSIENKTVKIIDAYAKYKSALTSYKLGSKEEKANFLTEYYRAENEFYKLLE